ncbi:Crp/Fnr family transcriptional regulator [Streptomyces sp. RKND-216]|uniref:Crp/Fnr family transcriptional regulator n=1 Tax=Streptomyces sp. RKND-216 TaxID=2562581 RepID=UPI00109DD57A|nr:Crp/Fnr family transcriptional regulator [Streptomyces sp. RKND-216]THA24102.1 Crp/Fnr family transcriptional regulator [Streptomyces sp. RKND-216]
MSISYAPTSPAVTSPTSFMSRIRESLECRTRIGTRVTLAKNDCAYSCGDPDRNIYFLESGSLKTVTFSRNGKECLLRICCPGEVFGEQGSVFGHVRSESTIAMQDSVMRRMPYSRFLSAIADEGLVGDFVAYLAYRLAEQQQAITNLTTVDSEQRLATTLLDLANKLGNGDPVYTRIEQRLTHEELARMVGTTRSRIGFFLKTFRAHGLLDISPSSRFIIHRPRLTAYLETRHS